MSFRRLESFTQLEIEKASKFSSVLVRYLENPGNDPISVRNRNWAEVFLNSFFAEDATEEAVQNWSETADQIIRQIAGRHFAKDEVAIFAFGKLGSRELNLSSDVDLVLVCNETSEHLTSLARKLQRDLSSFEDRGLLFRVDYEIRPGGRSGPLVSSLEQMLDYYGNYGEVWERMAFIRLRPIWGSASIIDSVLKFKTKFSFRRHLDYGIFTDLKILRQKVHANEELKFDSNRYIHLKLGVGGIRDIELFCHALQVIHGGRISALQRSGTGESFEELEKAGLLPADDARFLKEKYWFLRRLENFVQGENDQQTHLLEKARLQELGFPELTEVMTRVDQIVSTLLGSVDSASSTFPEDASEQRLWLLNCGFSENEIESDWRNPFEIPVLSRQKERDSHQKSVFLSLILKAMGQHASHLAPHRLLRLHDFLSGTKAKTSFFALLIKNPMLIQQLAEVFCGSPRLSRIFISRPELLDSLILRNVAPIDETMEWDVFLESLVELKQISEFLLAIEFLKSLDIEKLCLGLSTLADEIVQKIWKKISLEFDLSQVRVLALGKWGGQELGLFSDLDCVFLSEQQEISDSTRKGLRRFLNRLTESHRGGSLYQMDQRLRLADHSGLMISNQNDVETYLSEKAQAWERQAYLKSRVIGILSRSIKNDFIAKEISTDERTELLRIQKELHRKAHLEFDLKYAPGGLLETELAVQTAILHFHILNSASDLKSQIQSWITRSPTHKNELEQLQLNYLFFRTVEQLLRLFAEEPNPQLQIEHPIFEQISAAFQMSANQFELKLRSAFKQQSEILKNLDPRKSQS